MKAFLIKSAKQLLTIHTIDRLVFPATYSTQAKMSSSRISEVPEVDIDPSGVFKYILIKVHDPAVDNVSKDIVRGYARCSYHADIYEEVEEKELKKRKLDGECLGGGRIKHDSDNKAINVYGYSQGYGKADHTIAVSLLKKVYTNYNITWSDEGY